MLSFYQHNSISICKVTSWLFAIIIWWLHMYRIEYLVDLLCFIFTFAFYLLFILRTNLNTQGNFLITLIIWYCKLIFVYILEGMFRSSILFNFCSFTDFLLTMCLIFVPSYFSLFSDGTCTINPLLPGKRKIIQK